MQLNRDVLADPAVWSFLVVVSALILNLRSCVVKAHEPVRIQAFAPELAVEGFDERIVRRLSGSPEVKGDTVRVGPEIEIAGDELASLVNADRLRITDLRTCSFQSHHHVLRSVAETGIDDR